MQYLFVAVAERYQQPAFFRELLDVRFRNLRRRGPDENRIIGCELAPAQRTVAEHERDVVRSHPAENFSRSLQQHRNALDGKNLRREPGQECRLVSRAGSNLQHLFFSSELEKLEVPGVNRWLRDRLAIADRERRIFVGAVPDSCWNEQMTRYRVDCMQDREVPDSLLLQGFNETAARTAILLKIYWSSHQLSDASSIA